MAYEHDEAWILRMRDLGESDRIVVLLTGKLGKLDAVARGARKSKKRFSSLGLFGLYHIVLSYSSQRDLQSLTACDAKKLFHNIGPDVVRFACAAYGAELLGIFAPYHDPVPELFALASWFFNAVDSDDEPFFVLSRFLVRLLVDSGLSPDLKECVACGRAYTGADAMYSGRFHGLLCPKCRASDPRAVHLPGMGIRFVQNSLAGTPVSYDPGALTVTRRIIAVHLGAEPHSGKFLDTVMGNA